jgi:carbohydrate-selective porin OprB
LLTSPASAADLPTTKRPVGPPAAAAAPSPFDLNVTYTGEEWYNTGGLKDGANYIYGVDASLGIDLQKLLGFPNARFYAEGFYVAGKSQDFTYTSALQAPSALDAALL